MMMSTVNQILFRKSQLTIFLFLFSDDLTEKEIEIKLEISKKAGLLRKPCKFTDVSGRIDEKIEQNEALGNQYIDRNPVHRFAYFNKNLTDYHDQTFRFVLQINSSICRL